MINTPVFIIFALACGVLSQSDWGDCQRVNVKGDFNAGLYLGKWYDIAHMPFYEEENSACIVAQYEIKDDGHVKVNNSERVGGISGTYEEAIGDAYAPDPTQPAKLAVSFGGVGDLYRAPYWVVDTDYKTYSIVFSCTSLAGVYHLEYAWILSRTPTLPNSTITNLNAVWTSYGVNVQDFVYTQQVGCW
eukprot:TRINITY_DN748_c0_g1_i1.p1 TRINITY_DN748_c0_g1~~TRINITY_DN748_c0_g1_i1.p1  ORF type:complete len:189 (+),score=18.18 TRINITY_DN748_c0_g1_i1:92-658(+)